MSDIPAADLPFTFADADDESSAPAHIDDILTASLPEAAPWKILVVDDDEEMHAVTRFVLNRCRFEGRDAQILDAFTGAEAVEAMREHPDVAVALVDVVMENDHAGLDAVRRIRSELGNHLVRVVLRTGQPGMAPERQAIADYDINGYLAKAEVTVDKLYSAILTAVRSYRQLRLLDDSSRGLRQVIDATAAAFRETSLTGFTSSALQQLSDLMVSSRQGRPPSGLAADATADLTVIAATGRFADKIGLPVREALCEADAQTLVHLGNAALEGDSGAVTGCDGGPRLTAVLQSTTGACDVLFVERAGPADELERQLLTLYTSNLAIAYDNLNLRNDAGALQREGIFLLAETVERRLGCSVHHIRRISEIVRLLCRGAGIGMEDADNLALAAALHDVGMQTVPDAVLAKPGQLNADDWRAVRGHCWAGFEMLKASQRPLMRLAGRVALTHHERWDGYGYPQGLKGQDIPLSGRIVALADSIDALLCNRPHRPAWAFEKMVDHIADESGRAFDPDLGTVFIDHADAIRALRQRLPDPAV